MTATQNPEGITTRQCSKCHGTGSHPMGICYPCNGTGEITVRSAARKAADAAATLVWFDTVRAPELLAQAATRGDRAVARAQRQIDNERLSYTN